jgi:hypothetical protein
MSYQYHGTSDLIALPGRSVQTYPSGLVRVERSFMCRKADVARYRNILRVNEPMPFDNGAPAIDGLFIFPEPQEQVRDDGFVEFRVTAYGRTNIFSQIAVEKSIIKSQYLYIIEEIIGELINFPAQILTRDSFNEIYTIRGVLASSESPIAILTPPNIGNLLVVPARTTEPLVAGIVNFPEDKITVNGVFFTRVETTALGLLLENMNSTNFGQWNEYAVTWRAAAGVVSFYQ